MVKNELTLRQLNFDKPLYPYPLDHPTKLMSECIQIYNYKKLEDYTAEDLTKMLRSEIEPGELVELALDYICENLFYKADQFPGDLLAALSVQNKGYWREHPEQKEILVAEIKKFEERLERAKDLLEI